jgi:predicted nucleic acid-binding protein
VAALRLSFRHSHSAYDTAFLALAEARNAPLLTADEKRFRKFRAHSDGVVLLRNL